MMFLQDRVDEFMRPFIYEDGQWFYRPRGADVSVPLSEQEVNEAEERFRFRYKLGFVGMWAIVLPVVVWVYVQVVGQNRSLLLFLTVLPAYYIGFLVLLSAMASASRPYRKRMWDLEVQKHSGEPESAPKTPWHKVPPRKIMVQRTWLLFAIFVGWSMFTLWEHRNNVRALNGVTVAAKVTRSDDRDDSKCRVGYAYVWGSNKYEDLTPDCALMKSHPIGSTLLVRVDPERPGHSMAPGASAWPPEAVVPLFIGVLLGFLIVVL